MRGEHLGLAMWLGVGAALSACGDDAATRGRTDASSGRPDASWDGDLIVYVPWTDRDLDVLFVVDNSGSMRQEQESLADNFPRFIEVLESIEGGLPNIHLGIVSSNVGTGPVGGGGEACAGNGDNGDLLVKDGCAALTDGRRFIEDILVDAESGTRAFNYTGDLATQFSCMAQLGTSGCGFEQHLESMKRALEPGNLDNEGFLRDDARLAVIFLQDEDDCSTTTEGREMFDASQDDRDAPLGELASFRCFEFGTTCEPAAERSLGPRDDCIPGDDDTDYMETVAPYVDFLKGLKDDPRRVVVAGIMGDRENSDGVIVVGENPELGNELWVEPVCVVCQGGASSGCPLSPSEPDGALVAAAPSVRMRAFLDAFPQRSAWQNICSYDSSINGVNLSGALARIAGLVKKSMSGYCLDGSNLATPLDCRVFDADPVTQEESRLPRCEEAAPPCWTVSEDLAQCPDGGVSVEVDRGGSPPPPDTEVVVRCVQE